MTTGQRVLRFREQAGLKQCDLARRTGLSQGTISQIESGRIKPGPKSALALARVMRIQPTTLLYGDEDA